MSGDNVTNPDESLKEACNQKKFEITNSTPPYQPSKKAEPNFHIISNLSSDFSEECNLTHKLYISKRARNQIFEHIDWDKKTSDNQVEQGGILIGQAFIGEKDITYGVVEEAIAGKSAKRWSTYLILDHRTWKEMTDRFDEILDVIPEKDLQIIGWYHTHPNGLNVFMSGTDRATQKQIFTKDWQFAVVLNPHKKVWRAFYGKDSEECKGFMIEDSLDSTVHSKFGGRYNE